MPFLIKTAFWDKQILNGSIVNCKRTTRHIIHIHRIIAMAMPIVYEAICGIVMELLLLATFYVFRFRLLLRQHFTICLCRGERDENNRNSNTNQQWFLLFSEGFWIFSRFYFVVHQSVFFFSLPKSAFRESEEEEKKVNGFNALFWTNANMDGPYYFRLIVNASFYYTQIHSPNVNSKFRWAVKDVGSFFSLLAFYIFLNAALIFSQHSTLACRCHRLTVW